MVVTGSQEADFFRAGDGSIEKIAGFKLEKPRYADREGYFKTRGRGMTISSGAATYKAKKEKILQDFRREFKKTLKSVLADFSAPDRIVVCTPAYLINNVCELFSRAHKNAIQNVIRGNFYGRHPFEVLEKLKNSLRTIK